MTRWLPGTEEALGSALARGLLTEGHFFDAKKELMPGKGGSKNLAIDVASFAVDGGLIAVGVWEDKEQRTFDLSPVVLDGLAERVDQVTRSLVDPPLQVSCSEVPAPGRDGRGYLLVTVPASPLSPHMVDGKYRGRSDTTNIVLNDAEVRRLHDRAALTRDRAIRTLRAEVERDPSPPSDTPQAHLFVVAQPVAADPELLYRSVGSEGLSRWIEGRIRGGPPAYRPGSFRPDLSDTETQRRADGFALATYNLGPGRVPRSAGLIAVEDTQLLELEVRKDGGLRLFCGRGSFTSRDGPQRLALEPLIAGLTYRVLLAAVEVMTTTRYRGAWDLAVAVTNLRGCHSSLLYNTYGSRFTDLPYSAESYEQAIRVEGGTLMDRPLEVLESLCGRLHRGLSGAKPVYELVAPLTP